MPTGSTGRALANKPVPPRPQAPGAPAAKTVHGSGPGSTAKTPSATGGINWNTPTDTTVDTSLTNVDVNQIGNVSGCDGAGTMRFHDQHRHHSNDRSIGFINVRGRNVLAELKAKIDIFAELLLDDISGFIGCAVIAPLIPVARKRYREAEERRMQARDFG